MQAKLLTLKKSYRSTTEISRFANRIAGIEGEEAFERHGKEPEWVVSGTEAEMLEELKKRLMVEVEQKENYETMAVVTTNMQQAEDVYFALKDKLPVTLLNSESNKIEKGIVVTTLYLAKGLEFDSVHVTHVPQEDKLTEHQRQILYIAATRALHELTVYGFDA